MLRLTRALAALFLTSCLAAAAAADAPVSPGVSRDTQRVDLTQAVPVLEDRAGDLAPEDVAALAARGAMRVVHNPRSAIYRFHTLSTLWLKLDIEASATAPADWLLVVEPPVHDRVRLYVQDEAGGWAASQEVGTAVPFSARPLPHKNFVFPVKLAPGKATTMLLRTQDAGVASVRAALWQPQALMAHDRLVDGFFFLYFGLLGGMILYNLLLYVMVRDSGYLIYVAFVACLGIGIGANTGLGTQYIWGEWPWWSSRAISVGYAGAIVFSTSLTRHFISTKRRLPVADKVLRAIVAVGACAVFSALVLPTHIASGFIIPGVLATSLMTGGLSILAVVRRWPGAVYFCAAWLMLHSFSLVAITKHLQILPWTTSTSESLALGSAVEMILLSLALADRINEERRQKLRAQSHTLAILKASHALGTETRLDRLHSRLCEAMAAIAGATGVRFVLRDGDLQAWYLSEPGEEGHRLRIEDAAARGLLSLAAVQHVERTLQPLIVADACADERFGGDPAFANATRCSLLVMPVVHHGVPIAMLLLENRERSGAFSDVALGAVEAIAGPLAVSLENVLLYERLEQRVAEQTRELRETQKELLVTARRAGMAEIATNVLHNVGNALNSVNVSAQLIRSRVSRSRAQGLARAVELLESRAEDIGHFMQYDARGRMLAPYLRELANAQAEERQELLDHLERLGTSVDHIKNVVATQHAYAGASMFTEQVKPVDLVGDALRIAGPSLRDEAVELATELADVPQVLIDRTRTVQILVNLLENARQAMRGLPAPERRMSLRLDTAEGRLRFEVRDCGCGIPPENIERIFSHGFTTRADGHGFGLHSCAIAASEMGGTLAAVSDGPGQGATFTLELPLVPA